MKKNKKKIKKILICWWKHIKCTMMNLKLLTDIDMLVEFRKHDKIYNDKSTNKAKTTQ